jgi:hypothetical protein
LLAVVEAEIFLAQQEQVVVERVDYAQLLLQLAVVEL